jgi:hypothetical protein
MKTLFILFNGARRVGKTTFARRLTNELNMIEPYSAIMESFDQPLRHFIAGALGAPYRVLSETDVPLSVLHGYSVNGARREAIEFMRDRFGSDVLARLLAYRVMREGRAKAKFVVVDSCETRDDVEYFENRYVINVVRDGHIEEVPLVVNSRTIHNNNTPIDWSGLYNVIEDVRK